MDLKCSRIMIIFNGQIFFALMLKFVNLLKKEISIKNTLKILMILRLPKYLNSNWANFIRKDEHLLISDYIFNCAFWFRQQQKEHQKCIYIKEMLEFSKNFMC